jgi:hypothetical protein
MVVEVTHNPIIERSKVMQRHVVAKRVNLFVNTELTSALCTMAIRKKKRKVHHLRTEPHMNGRGTGREIRVGGTTGRV